MHLWNLCIHIDTNTGLKFDGDAVIPDGDLLDPASHQCFIEFCKVGSLLCDIILQVIDSLYLFVPCGGIDGGLLAQFPKPEYFIGIFVIGFFARAFWMSSCCKAISFSSMFSTEVACEARMTEAMFSCSCV